VIEKADNAMYLAKPLSTRRNRVLESPRNSRLEMAPEA